MKKNGFTLAEVLITVGVIGILAAVTIPTLVKNNQNQIFANSLSAAVSDFENAMNAMITKEGVYNLYETNAWTDSNNFVTHIKKTMNIVSNGAPTGYYTTVKPINSSTNVAVGTALEKATTTVESKKKYLYHIGLVTSGEGSDLAALVGGVNLSKIAAYVYIDVNSKDDPNKIGRDIFGFLLGNDGILYPLGGKDATYKLENDTEDNPNTDDNEAVDKMTKTWDSSNSTYACTDGTYKTHGLGCTARLIESNYKMDY